MKNKILNQVYYKKDVILIINRIIDNRALVDKTPAFLLGVDFYSKTKNDIYVKRNSGFFWLRDIKRDFELHELTKEEFFKKYQIIK